jgi:alpha-1,2-mannosyltransferase
MTFLAIGAWPRLVGEIRSGEWLSRKRVVAYCWIFLIVQAAAVVVLLLGQRGLIDSFGRPLGTDFISFYAAGKLVASHDPAIVYQPAVHFAMERQVAGNNDIPYYSFYYPPTFLIVSRLLSTTPYLVALAVWLTSTGIAFAIAIRAILPIPGMRLASFAFPAVFLNIGHGQNGFLSASLFAAATALLDRRPFLAGMAFGALCYKPQLAVLTPVALLFGRQWRAVAGACLAAVTLMGVSALVFGTNVWRAYAAFVPMVQSTLQGGGGEFEKMAGIFGAVRLLGGGAGVGQLAQLVAILLAAVATAFVWTGRTSVAARSATLAGAALVASPLLWDYDLVLATVAAAWLVREGRCEGFLAWEKSLLAALFVVPLISRPIGEVFHLPLAALVGSTLLALALAHAGARRARIIASEAS